MWLRVLSGAAVDDYRCLVLVGRWRHGADGAVRAAGMVSVVVVLVVVVMVVRWWC